MAWPSGRRLEPLALSVSGRERMVNGRAAASGEKTIDFSEQIAWFGDILKEWERSSRSGPVCSLTNRLSVSGSSQRGRVRARPDPAGGAWSVARGAWGGRILARGTLGTNQVYGCWLGAGTCRSQSQLVGKMGGKMTQKGSKIAAFLRNKLRSWL